MFENPKLGIGDDLMKPFQILRDEFSKNGHTLCSISEGPMADFDAVFFIEWPTLPFFRNPYFREAQRQKKKLYLLLMESEVIRPSNYRKSHHKYFEKIFTWHDDLVDGVKYIKYSWPQNIPDNIVFSPITNRKLITLISSHKLNDHPFELYSERIHAIRFFEKYAQNDFDLYGAGWGAISFRKNFMKYAPLFPGFATLKKYLQRFLFVPFPSWKGKVDSKHETLSKYKFAICYENAKNIPGYITEKIFDCFFAGCVPIYLGPPNKDVFIPTDTYIDKNNFSSYKELLSFLRSLSDDAIMGYQNNIRKFLEGPAHDIFSSQAFAKILIQNITQ